jgi:hypothetical protein
VVESTVPTIIIGAAGRTEAEATRDTLAEICFVALINLVAVLALLREIVTISTYEEILEDRETNLVMSLPGFLTC